MKNRPKPKKTCEPWYAVEKENYLFESADVTPFSSTRMK